ncbi:helix-turn-helix transcriptional regulator [Streptomyces sp. M10(2022)]
MAQLAGLSVEYVVRLEQGRGPRPSTQVLTALTQALRLEHHERDQVFRLAGSAPPLAGGSRCRSGRACCGCSNG